MSPEGPTSRYGIYKRLLDYALAVSSVICCAYIVLEYDQLIVRMGAPTSLDVGLGAMPLA